MEYSFYDLLSLLGALGFFIYGMKIMSEGIQQAAGEKLRMILSTMTQNRYLGVLTGFLITGIVQSSSATTVMTVSFVNAGLLSLTESAGVMMGANIGTTVTAWVISILGFKVKISALSLPIIAFGLPMFVAGKKKIKSWGQFMIGFALLFMGLSALQASVPDIQNNPEFLEFLSKYTSMGVFSRILFVLIGALLTVIIQSSSAAMALTLVMTYNGWISFDIAASLVLGENIGTTITAELASLVGNVHAKRSARIHSSFNIIGVTWMLLLIPFFLNFVDYMMVNWMGEPSPYDDPTSVPTALALFHTVFNAINVLLLIAFVPQLVNLAIRLVPAKGDEDELYQLEYINKLSPVDTSELILPAVEKELKIYGELVVKMKNNLNMLIYEKSDRGRSKLLSEIIRQEEITDRIEEDIDQFLIKVSEKELSPEASEKIRNYLSIASDMERIGDIILRMAQNVERGNNSKVTFNPAQKESLEIITNAVNEAFDIMTTNLEGDYKDANVKAALDKEIEINKCRNLLRTRHLKSVEERDYNIRSGIIYRDLFFSYEQLGDHVAHVSEAIGGSFLIDEEDLDN